MNRAFRLSLLAVRVALLVALAAAIPILSVVLPDGPTVHTTWCPPPEDRAASDDGPPFVAAAPAVEPSQVVTRLREIRRKAAGLHPTLDLDSPPVPGSAAELDGLLRDLIADLDGPAREETP